MPGFDSGHIFLTTLAPIRDSATGMCEHGSFTQSARIALARMPTALQSPATERMGVNSPFSRNRRTHLARMFVLNDVVYNGRAGKNALAAALTKDDPAIPQPVDRLKTSYLVFCADIDAVEQDGAPIPAKLTPEQQCRVRDAYARELWETMEPELRAVYVNCEGFGSVNTAQDFADYLDRCHVETTMPFHDYYLELPSFNLLPLQKLIWAVAVPAILAVIALFLRLFGVLHVFGINTLLLFILGVLATGVAAYFAIRHALENGNKPLPPGKYDDLPSVLKSLYLQQHFSDFVVEAQGASPQELHAQFGAFLAEHKPGNRVEPTQPPGVISTSRA